MEAFPPVNLVELNFIGCEHKASFPDQPLTDYDIYRKSFLKILCGSFWDFQKRIGQCSLTCTPDKYKNQNVTEMQSLFPTVLSFFSTFKRFRFSKFVL